MSVVGQRDVREATARLHGAEDRPFSPIAKSSYVALDPEGLTTNL